MTEPLASSDPNTKLWQKPAILLSATSSSTYATLGARKKLQAT